MTLATYNLAQRFFDRAFHDLDTGRFVVVVALHLFESCYGADVGYAAARDDALFYGGAGCGQRIVHAVFLLFHFHLAGSADIQYGHAAGQFGQTLGEFFLIVIRSRDFHLLADLCDAVGDGFLVANAVYDGRA